MTNLKIDYFFTFDQDNTLSLLNTERFNCMITEELPDWWASPLEKEEARIECMNIDNMIASLQYDLGEMHDPNIS